jgi:hypothetical protein
LRIGTYFLEDFLKGLLELFPVDEGRGSGQLCHRHESHVNELILTLVSE